MLSLQIDTTQVFHPFWHQMVWAPQDTLFEATAEVVPEVTETSTISIGFGDVVSVISIPLIIMLFSFAFPFIFDIINHINSKYESKGLSNLFENHITYKLFWAFTFISLGYVFILGVLHLLLPTDYLVEINDYVNWCSLVVAFLYSVVVILFIRYCVHFNKADRLVGYIEKAYRRESKKKPSFWGKAKHGFKKWRHRKDNDWLKAYNMAVRFSGFGKNSAEQLYNELLIALCKYALREHDVTLFYGVMERLDKIIEKEKQAVNRSFSSRDDELTEGHPHFNTTNFFNEIFVFYANCHQDKNIEDLLAWKYLSRFSKSRFVSDADIFFIAQTLLKLCDTGQQRLLEKYIDRARYHFKFILDMPKILYVQGQDASKRKAAEAKCFDNWNTICNFHFLAFSYALSKGMYGLLGSLMAVDAYWDHNLLPSSSQDILIRYARCKVKLKETGYYGYWKIEDIFDKKVDVDSIIGDFAMMLLMLSRNNDYNQTEKATAEDLTVLGEQREKLITKAQQIQSNGNWNSLYDTVEEDELKKLFDDALKKISASIGGYDSLSKAESEKDKNWYKELVSQKQKAIFEKQFDKADQSIERLLPKQFMEGGSQNTTTSIDINECVFLVEKLYFVSSDEDMARQLYWSYMEVLTSRVVYAMLTAYQLMKVKDISMTVADFGHFVDEYTQNMTDDYLLVDVDSSLHSWLTIDYGANFKTSYKGIPYLKVESVGRFSYLTDSPAFDYFKGSILLIRKATQPALKDKTENAAIKFCYDDVSSEEQKKLELRVGVELGKMWRFDPNATIVRVRTKKMIV